MKVLILGYSDLVKRKVLPAIANIKEIESVDIATRTGKVKDFIKLENVYSDYTKGLNNSNAEIVYISLPNSLHYKFSKLSIENQKNVIVDKPAVLNKNEFFSLNELLSSNKLFISMSCVFNFHKAWLMFKKHSLSSGTKGTLISEFTIPKLENKNIRMSKKLKGGALNDMGIYATTVGFLFWDKPVKSIKLKTYQKNSLIEGFTLLANYGRGQNLIGNFGFNQIYTNKITFSGNGIKTEYDRVFSQTPDYGSKIYKTTNSEEKVINVGRDDAFLKYLKYVVGNAKVNKKLLNLDFKKSNLEYLKLLDEYE